MAKAPAPSGELSKAPTDVVAMQAPVTEQKTLRGYVIERPGSAGEGPSFYLVSAKGWTWDRDKATVFPSRNDAKALVAKKQVVDGVTQQAGAASAEGAKVVKFDAGSDDE